MKAIASSEWLRSAGWRMLPRYLKGVIMTKEEFLKTFESHKLAESDFDYLPIVSRDISKKEEYVNGVDYIVVPCLVDGYRKYRDEIMCEIWTHKDFIPEGFNADLFDWAEHSNGLISTDDSYTVGYGASADEVAIELIESILSI